MRLTDIHAGSMGSYAADQLFAGLFLPAVQAVGIGYQEQHVMSIVYGM